MERYAGHTSGRGVLAVLSFALAHDTIGVSEVGRHLDLTKSTAHRLIKTLCSEGFLRRVPPGHYRATGLVRATGLQALGCLEVWDAVNSSLVALAEQTGCVPRIVSLDGGDTRLLRLAGTPVGVPIGRRVPATRTAAGKMLLSCLRDPDIHALLGAGAREEVMAEIGRTRAHGFATNVDGHLVGENGLAVRLRAGGALGAPLALAISGPPHVLQPSVMPAVADELTRSARRLTETWLG